jgi:hypothetical protein
MSRRFLFLNLSPIKIPYFITLADGLKVENTGVGQVSLLASLNLDSILLIPGNLFNIISISKLTPPPS